MVAGRFWCSYAWVSLTPTAPARPRGCLCACVRGCRRACVRACSPVRVCRRVHAGVCVRVHVCVRSFRRRRCVYVVWRCVLRCRRCGGVVCRCAVVWVWRWCGVLPVYCGVCVLAHTSFPLYLFFSSGGAARCVLLWWLCTSFASVCTVCVRPVPVCAAWCGGVAAG